MSNAVLEVNNVEKSFDDLMVLRDVSLTVHEGEVISIIGSSGSGKTTLLRCITHLETVDGGSILVGGEALVSPDPETGKAVYAEPKQLKKLCAQMGLVFQNFNLFPHWSILRNVTEAPVSVRGIPREQAEKEGMEMLRKLGLSSKADAYPFQLSGGQQQRAAIARALVLKPKVLFFDEPTSALDPELTGEVLKVIRGLAKEHMTMVIVTHEMLFARDVSDRIVFMDDGVVVENSTPAELFASENPRTKEFLGKYLNPDA
jgi:polar amino acid transport system ATP-binding protein